MAQKILVVGAGFAGLWSALAARRLIELNKDRVGEGIEVIVVAPEPRLVVRPRLYESNAAGMSAPLGDLFAATGIKFVQGIVDIIRTEDHEVEMVNIAGLRSTLSYDRLVLAAGSRVVRPDLPGLQEHAFTIDTLNQAADFEAHLHRLAALPDSPARNTVVVCGGGFTGIELATELPSRLRTILGIQTKVRVVVVERSDVIGPELGDSPRPVITKALEDLKVETKLGAAVVSVDAQGVTTSTGERIEALSVVWIAGMEATQLTKQIPGKKDRLGRLHVDRDLRVPSCEHVFATGDAAYAATDDKGHYTLMSCQHAVPLGRACGNNVAADLLKVEGRPYEQLIYGTLLDLGGWGSILCDGWERQVSKAGAIVKEAKHYVNRSLIYPPSADIAFAAADPSLVPANAQAIL